MKKRIIAGVLALGLLATLIPAAFSADLPEDNTAALTYEALEERIKQAGPGYLILEETIASIEAVDYDKLTDDLRDTLNTVAKAQWGMFQLSQLPAEYGGGSLDTYTYGRLGESYTSLKGSFEDLRDGEIQKDNEGVVRQLRDTQNQILMTAKSLYVALLEMENGREQLERTIAATERMAQEMELRYERGQISDVQLTEVKNGLEQLYGGKATLERNIMLYTVQLQALAGMELTGELTLAEVPEITQEQISRMNYAKDLQQAKEVSYTLYAADETLADAKEDYQDTANKYSYNPAKYEYVSARHTYQAAQYTHKSAYQSFEMQFLTAYSAVGEYQTALKTAESTLELKTKSYAAQELKYKQGTLSRNGLLSAKDELANAEDAVLTAKHNLFTAYLAYQQAVELGVLN